MSTVGRQKLACKECTRRKIGCDKAIPCSNCVKRGQGSECQRDQVAAVSPGTRRSADGPDNDALTRRVATLEGTLLRLTSAVERLAQKNVEDSTTEVGRSAQTSLADDSPNGTEEDDSDDVRDASTVIEFLAWGRRKTLVETQESDMSTENSRVQSYSEYDLSRIKQISQLLPPEVTVRAMCRYHQACLLWYDGGYHAPTFGRKLDMLFESHDIMSSSLSRQPLWFALLFAILSSSMACASSATACEWGYNLDVISALAKSLYEAAVSCLEIGDYMGKPTLHSIQCIATLTLPAHLLGCSTKQSILIATAIKIAQTLGIHQLGKECADQGPALIERECRRRVWCQLATQDFFQTPFSETNTVNLILTSTDKPRNCHDDDFLELPDSVPTLTSFIRYKYDVAKLLHKLQVDVASVTTIFAQYEHVLKFDAELRELATTGRPAFLAPGPLQESWPEWVPWARRALRISCAHKIIMIHRKFISLSFTNEAFALTRKTCIAASKTILRCLEDGVDPHAPVLWIEHAFTVTACVILAFDLLYSSNTSAEWQKTHHSIKSAIQIISQAKYSKIALRGTRLVTILLQRVTQAGSGSAQNRKRKRHGSKEGTRSTKRFDTRSFVHDFLSVESADAEEPTSSANVHLESATQVPQHNDDMLDLFNFGEAADMGFADALDIPFEMFNNFEGGTNPISLTGQSPLHDIFCGL